MTCKARFEDIDTYAGKRRSPGERWAQPVEGGFSPAMMDPHGEVHVDDGVVYPAIEAYRAAQHREMMSDAFDMPF